MSRAMQSSQKWMTQRVDVDLQGHPGTALGYNRPGKRQWHRSAAQPARTFQLHHAIHQVGFGPSVSSPKELSSDPVIALAQLLRENRGESIPRSRLKINNNRDIVTSPGWTPVMKLFSCRFHRMPLLQKTHPIWSHLKVHKLRSGMQ